MYCKIIYFNISKLTLYVFLLKLLNIQEHKKKKDMDISSISAQELISLQDEDIHDFITELFNENNTLPKCE